MLKKERERQAEQIADFCMNGFFFFLMHGADFLKSNRNFEKKCIFPVK